MILYGRNSVAERLKADPASIKKIFLQNNFNDPAIEQSAQKNSVPLERLPPEKLMKIKDADNLQGIIAQAADFQYGDLDELLRIDAAKKTTFIFLDSVYDPHNLGSIIRTAACLGGFAIVIPKHKACEVTEAVLHVASGGENYVPVVKAVNLSTAIIKAKEAGYWIAGAVVGPGGENLDRAELAFPLGIVLGSEGEGIRYGVEKHLDMKVRIPMEGAALSFNVTIACAMFCYEIAKRKRSQEGH
ncbi:MAG: 23S rRNA (guanosine(2251)-2'-O)-methyltransferase RlmB [Candidatus Omnitrophica bacterium]|nr:23S rRNA (guanosine(2251)-2'-O)-methyltransferase RlmB [Candidatus Omnitrophota bacterium]